VLPGWIDVGEVPVKAVLPRAGDGSTCGLMRRGVDGFSSFSWEPQEEGMMSTAASFSLSKKPRFIESRKKSILQKVMLASLVTSNKGTVNDSC
jgi:hypothetical protein